ncbi:MAG: SirB2 family protein [Ferrovum sp.]|nr:SirB2 family protein [Ferrovum sp.]
MRRIQRGLMMYVLVGFIALRSNIGEVSRIISWLGAQLIFLYIVIVAITHNPIP